MLSPFPENNPRSSVDQQRFPQGPATMAGHDSGTQHKFTGFQKYFNSYTITGRRNYVIATYASIAMIILYFKLRPKKQSPAVTEK
ncbi:ATP synthase F(0) complex subunit k, mitochondrial isoform X1 [Natator depressus]